MTTRPNGTAGPEDGQARSASPDRGPSPAAQWADWVTIWESELNALAADREAQHAWTKFVSVWAAQARAAGAILPDGARGSAGPEPSQGTAAAPSAPGAGELEQRQQQELERLVRRVEELERRLAELSRP